MKKPNINGGNAVGGWIVTIIVTGFASFIGGKCWAENKNRTEIHSLRKRVRNLERKENVQDKPE